MTDYYTPLSDKIFEEIKEKSIEIWKTYDDSYGYATEKTDRIKDLKNIQDNGMTMVAMFDSENQIKFANTLSDEAKMAIRDRMIAGGTPPQYITF